MQTIALLFKVLWAPQEVFHAVSKRPRILAPLALLTLFAALESAVVFSALDPGELRLRHFESEGYADKVSESDKAIHAESARSYRALAAVFSTTRSLVVVPVVAGVFFLLLGMGRGAGFRSFLAVTAFAFVPTIFHSIAIIGTVLALEPTPENLQLAGSISPIVFLNQASVPRGVYFALTMVDAISIWILALLTVGYGFVPEGRVSPVLRVGAVAAIYLVWSGLYVAIRLASA